MITATGAAAFKYLSHMRRSCSSITEALEITFWKEVARKKSLGAPCEADLGSTGVTMVLRNSGDALRACTVFHHSMSLLDALGPL